ncbi:hypothetical protein BDP27DRAFT_1335695 [Rhodocollybia butyracea]|uniref:Uncharacterized protein n=1 Tax=Rhodocollybia butyracea TaxID=206335 RepID=A0A9P5PDA5_9AGAR|nr:hypothetical protein BDP27DRAFT_1335695 [Rhodocollybia butyracea]
MGLIPPLPAQNLILRELSPLDHYHYALAHKDLQFAVSSFNLQAFRIEHILLRYFSQEDINAFRLIQLKTDTLISGSAALQFFDLTVFENSDLDLYIVREWDKVMLLAGFLTSVAYDFTPRPDQQTTFQNAFEAGRTFAQPPVVNDDYPAIDIWDVYSFVRASDERKVQIITYKTNVLQVILGFHSTCVMNAISYTHAYSFYPYATFVERCSVAVPRHSWRISNSDRNSILRAFEKYAERGWRTEVLPTKTNALRYRSEFRDTARTVGDSACWTVALNPVQHARSSSDFDRTLGIDPIRANSWYTIILENGQVRMGCSLHDVQLHPGNLFTFTFPSVPLDLIHSRVGRYLGDLYPEDILREVAHETKLEDIVQDIRAVFDVEPDMLLERSRKLISDAHAKMPEFLGMNGKRLGPSLYGLLTLVRQLYIIFNSFREDPDYSLSFRISLEGQIWTYVVIQLPQSFPRFLIPSLKSTMDDYMTRHLMQHRVWISFRTHSGKDLDLWGLRRHVGLA